MEALTKRTFVQQTSAYGFDDTVSRLERAIETAGLIVFARIDHAQGARSVGLEMTPTLVLSYGHPRGGTPIMLAYPDSALELPLRVLIREETDGRTSVVFQPVVVSLGAVGVPREALQKLEPAQKLLLQAIAG